MSNQDRDEQDKRHLHGVAEQVLKMLAGDMYTLRQQRGVSNEEMDAVYALAHGYYRAGRLDEAEQAFLFLCLFEHLESKYWIGLGAVQQMKHDYAKALASYSYASVIDFRNPRALYYGTECHLALGHLDDAQETLSALLAVCPADTEEGQKWRARAEQLQAQVERLRQRGGSDAPQA